MKKPAEGTGVAIRKRSKLPGVMITQYVEELPPGMTTPDFTRKPIPLTIQEGKQALFTAIVNGDPVPEVSWGCNKGDISDTEKYITRFDQRNGEYILELPHVSSEQADTYKCLAINPFGRAVCTAALNVIEVGFKKRKPAPKNDPEDFRKMLKKKVVMRKEKPCKEGEIDPRFWEVLLSAHRKDYERICHEYGVTDFRWMLRKLNQMKMEREAEQSKYVEKVDSMKQIEVITDGTAKFELDMKLKDPSNKILLYKDGKMLDYGDGSDDSKRHNMKQFGETYLFSIRGLVPEDAGLYQVDVEDANMFSTSLSLPDVHFESALKDTTVVQGQDAVFECSLSKPLPQITWSANDITVEPGEKYDITVSKNKHSHKLAVKNCKAEDKGVYSAIVGLKSSQGTLVVEEDNAHEKADEVDELARRLVEEQARLQREKDELERKAQEERDEAARRKAQAEKDQAARKTQEERDEAARKVQAEKDEATRKAQAERDEAARRKSQAERDEAARKALAERDEAARRKAQEEKDEAARKAQAEQDEAARRKGKEERDEAARREAQAERDEAARKKAQEERDEAARRKAQVEKDEAAKRKAEAEQEEAARRKAQAEKDEATRKAQKERDEAARKAQAERDEAARRKAQEERDEAARKAQAERDEAARRKSQEERDEAARKAQAEKDEAARRKAQAEQDEATRRKAQAEKDEAARRKAQAEQDEAARRKAQEERDEAARKAQAEKDEAARRKAQAEQDEVGRRKAQAEQDEAARKKAQEEGDEAARRKAQAERDEAARRKGQAEKDEAARKSQAEKDEAARKAQAERDEAARRKGQEEKDEAARKAQAERDEAARRKAQEEKNEAARKAQAERDEAAKRKAQAEKDEAARRAQAEQDEAARRAQAERDEAARKAQGEADEAARKAQAKQDAANRMAAMAARNGEVNIGSTLGETGKDEKGIGDKKRKKRVGELVPDTIIDHRVHFLSGLSNTAAKVGERAELSCKLSSEDSTGMWYKDGKELEPKDTITVVKDGAQHKLIINNCHDKDSGKYKFEAEGYKSEATLTIEDPPKIDADALSKFSEPVNVKTGESASFKLPFSGKDPIRIQWFQDDEELQEGHSVKIEKSSTHSRLRLAKCQRKDTSEIKVKIKNEFATVEASSKLIVLDKPTPPQGPVETVESSLSAVEFKWKPPKDDGGCKVTNYNLERQQVGRNTWTKIGDIPEQPTYRDTDVGRGRKYCYKIRAENSEGLSDNLTSEVIAAGSLAFPGSPAPPKIASAFKDCINLAWLPPSNTGGGSIIGYNVEKRKKGSNIWSQVNPKDEPIREKKYAVKDITEGTEYEFRVSAINTCGPGEPSWPSECAFARDPKKPPGQVKDLKITGSSYTNLSLSWTKPTEVKGVEDEAKGYFLEIRPTDQLDWSRCNTNAVIQTSFTIVGMKSMASYWVRVIATNEGGEGLPQGLDNYIIAMPPPVKPKFTDSKMKSFMVVKAGNTVRVSVSFEASPLPDITWLKDGFPVGKHVTITNFDKGSQLFIYTSELCDTGIYTVTIKNVVGQDTFSIEIRVTDDPKPPGPVELEQNVQGTVTITWAPSPDEKRDDRLHYTVMQRDSIKGTWCTIADRLFNNKFTVINILPGREYNFRVFAKNDLSLSEPSLSPVWGTTKKKEKFTCELPKPKTIDFQVAPKFIVPLKLRAAPPGYECYMSCAVIGNPTPHITWYHDNVSLNMNTDYYITNVCGVCSLLILRVGPKDMGEYKVVAESPLGQAECSTKLVVRE